MRFGKPIEHLESAALATSVKDEFLRFCAVGKQLSYAGYLTFDGLIFVRFSLFHAWPHLTKVKAKKNIIHFKLNYIFFLFYIV